MIGDVTDSILRRIERAGDSVSEALFEPVVRLGVTGLSRSGKTVFIISLVANLLDRGRMLQLSGAQTGRIQTVFLQPQPDDMVPRFEYEKHLRAMTGAKPDWPQSTRSISQLRVSFKVQPNGIIAGLTGPKTVHLDIVDYPGEWLLDLPLLNQSYEDWSAATLARAKVGNHALHSKHWLDITKDCDPDQPLDEGLALTLAASFTTYLSDCREAGFSSCAPGRFLMPGDLEGSPALTFAPLPQGKGPRKSLHRAFERRFEAYKSGIVKPFFRDHFSRIDRQVVLVDALGAIHAGPQAVHDLKVAINDVMQSFRPGRNTWLSSLLGRKVERVLLAATKADHLHHSQHARLTAVMKELLKDATSRAGFAGAKTAAMAIASLRTTTETTIDHNGDPLDCVQGHLQDSGKLAAMYPGELPENPKELTQHSTDVAEEWLDVDYAVMKFKPAANTLHPDQGPPHIRMDRAAEFLFGDKL